MPPAQVAAARYVGPATTELRASLRTATDSANAEILTGIREVVRTQVAAHTALAREGAYTASQATALHRLAQTYRLLAAATEGEQSRYAGELAAAGDEDLDAALDRARQLAGRSG